MISRREVVTGGVLGTLAAGTPAEAAVAELQQEVQVLKEGFRELQQSIDSLKSSVDQGLRGNSMSFGNLGALRAALDKWARTSGRFPDYCDVGFGVWIDVYDWHVRQQQQINISRIADQRMAIQFIFTQLVLRWENEPGYIGTPYDR